MRKNQFTKALVIVSVIALLGGGIQAFAQQKATPDDTCPMVQMGKIGPGHWGGPRWLHDPSLSKEDRDALKKERQAFFLATRDLRQELKSKRLALKSEMAKKVPDPKTAKAIQAELSDLKAELAMKRLEHQLKMKKIYPYCDFGSGKRFGKRHGGNFRQGRMGPGRMPGHMQGRMMQ
jgi:Spy/CpxP family protein refolding chaperone